MTSSLQQTAHIALGNDEPGIRGLFRFRPETALPLNRLCDVLLRGDSTLTMGERELIATYVSSLNQCAFCTRTHAALAAVRLPAGMPLVDEVRADIEGGCVESAAVSEKTRALLRIAGAVQRGGLNVTDDLVADARAQGATDLEIHDTVLIAAAFCMFNRYVDGLGTRAPDDPAHYADRATRTGGYVTVLTESLAA